MTEEMEKTLRMKLNKITKNNFLKYISIWPVHEVKIERLKQIKRTEDALTRKNEDIARCIE